MKKKIIEAYAKLSKDYEKNVDTTSCVNAYYERPAMMELLPKHMHRRSVLDAGCAAGWYTQQFLKRGATVTAVDVSSEMVEATKRRVGAEATVFTHDIGESLPFQAETFDLIVSSLTLHYLDDWKFTFQEFHRVLKPNGQLIFSVHHPFMDFTSFNRPDYYSHELLMDVWHKEESGPVEVFFYRRPLHEIINATTKQFTLEQILEPKPIPEFKEKSASIDLYNRLMTNPQFLIVQARK